MAAAKANVDRFSGLAEVYDANRPTPPTLLKKILTDVDSHLLDFVLMRQKVVSAGAKDAHVERVVDLGSGTGLSTIFWSDAASEVIGIEPNEEMLAFATKFKTAPNIKYKQGFSHDTGLPDACADIVTCSQSLHWMEPTSTFKEVARILKPGGVFAAIDCDWPPTTHSWKAEKMYTECERGAKRIGESRGMFEGVSKYKKNEHLQRMADSNLFPYCKEIALHNIDQGDADRFVGLLLSQGGISTVLQKGVTPEELRLDELRKVVSTELGNTKQPWYWTYFVRYAVK